MEREHQENPGDQPDSQERHRGCCLMYGIIFIIGNLALVFVARHFS